MAPVRIFLTFEQAGFSKYPVQDSRLGISLLFCQEKLGRRAGARRRPGRLGRSGRVGRCRRGRRKRRRLLGKDSRSR